MDIFRFTPTTSPTRLEGGEIINGLKRKMWIERYDKDGEFTLNAPADLGIRDKLPIGSLISHVDTAEVMIVENHAISAGKGQEPQLEITGSGFESYLAQRVIGMNKNYPTVTAPADYILAPDESWDQAVTMLSDHLLAANLIDDDNALDYVSILSQVTGVVETPVARVIRYGDLRKALLDMLSISNLGIKIVRPGPSTPAGIPAENMALVIHVGQNRAGSVLYSYDTGEIESAEYLWSNKKLKNAAMVSGKWVETVVIPAAAKYDRRWMFVDASDIDGDLNAAPTGASLTDIINKMQQRGIQALAAQKDVALTKAEVSKNSTKAVYRKDFDVGDIITVQGDYNESASRRVSEFVEIEDETGSFGYPTLDTP